MLQLRCRENPVLAMLIAFHVKLVYSQTQSSAMFFVSFCTSFVKFCKAHSGANFRAVGVVLSKLSHSEGVTSFFSSSGDLGHGAQVQNIRRPRSDGRSKS